MGARAKMLSALAPIGEGDCFLSETLSLVFRSLIRIFNQLLLLEDTLALC